MPPRRRSRSGDPSTPKTTRPPASSRRPRPAPSAITRAPRVLDALPDRLDERDWLYRPTLACLPSALCHTGSVPFVLNQRTDGACTGYALAAVIHLLQRLRGDTPYRVSARMLYELARRYDEFPSDTHEGSTARATMKGWLRHGVCADSLWPAAARGLSRFTSRVAADAQRLARHQNPTGYRTGTGPPAPSTPPTPPASTPSAPASSGVDESE